MKHRVAVVAVIVLVLGLGSIPGSGAIHTLGNLPSAESASHCQRDQGTIRVGIGNVGNGVSSLHGITYVDLHHPACSSGRFTIDNQVVNTEHHCSDGFLRVYAPVGTIGETFIVDWRPHDAGSC